MGSLAGSGASYSASYSYDTLNRLTAMPLEAYTCGDSAHLDAATAIGRRHLDSELRCSEKHYLLRRDYRHHLCGQHADRCTVGLGQQGR